MSSNTAATAPEEMIVVGATGVSEEEAEDEDEEVADMEAENDDSTLRALEEEAHGTAGGISDEIEIAESFFVTVLRIKSSDTISDSIGEGTAGEAEATAASSDDDDSCSIVILGTEQVIDCCSCCG